MLPLWRDQIRIVLCQDRLVVLRMQGRSRSRIRTKQELCYSGTESGWQPIVALLDKLLASPGLEKADATVIFSNHFMRYLVLPWNDARLSDAEQMALVQHRFAEVYGDTGEAWEYRLSGEKYAMPTLASALPQAFLQHLQAAFKTSPLRLKSAQPYLMSAFNAFSRKLGAEAAWFILVERDTFCLGLLQDGQWVSVRLRRIVSDWFAEAMLLLERESLLLGHSSQKVWLLAPEMNGQMQSNHGAWAIHPLQLNMPPEISQSEIPGYMMAAAGL